MVNGRDCVIAIGTVPVPYAEETIREAVAALIEQASIEGDGVCRGIQKNCGVTGCIVTPLTIGTAPLLLGLALGEAGIPVFVSETRNLYRRELRLVPYEDGERFELCQERGERGKRFEACGVSGFELRIHQGEAVKLRLDIAGEHGGAPYPSEGGREFATGERFKENGVSYTVNGRELREIYGLTIAAKKIGGTKTEVWIHRVLEESADIPQAIEKLEVTARLYRDRYEQGNQGSGNLGLFRLRLSRLVMMSDETAVDAADAVIGPLRYYCAGDFTAEVFSEGN
ncbi:hypothetical protein TREPR_2105 [Treponema primitia ZAS-2]|uniref:Uncharacterized protein n=1 Tax=Treponema primitia (strain ATCC BAA-887 / DSM 12427 / ZAS-2) TaxID=545694 RepID=F5YJ85_TREPZ|nr:hypothetical protein [Treponema primitia]AEF84056.1 hypothetical protein TREPR_2105 [Treponema primitia ZAS-2]